MSGISKHGCSGRWDEDERELLIDDFEDEATKQCGRSRIMTERSQLSRAPHLGLTVFSE